MAGRAEAALAALLAVVAGFSDTVCLRRFGTFGAMQTGNAVYMGIAAAEQGVAGAGFFLCVIAANVVGVVIMDSILAVRGDGPSAWGLVSIITPTLCMLLAEALEGPLALGGWAVCLVSISMGMQNALTLTALGVNTTIVTGNLQKVGVLIARALRREAFSAADRDQGLKCTAVIVSTIAGSTVGAICLRASGPAWTLGPAAGLQFCSLTAREHLHGRLLCSARGEREFVRRGSSLLAEEGPGTVAILPADKGCTDGAGAWGSLAVVRTESGADL